MNIKQKISHQFGRAAKTYDNAASLQKKVADQLIQMLKTQHLSPKTALNLGCGTNHCHESLHTLFPNAHWIGVDISIPMLQESLKKPFPACDLVAADFDHLPFQSNSFSLIFSNMTLQWSLNIEETLSHCRKFLTSSSYFALTIPLLGTLRELPTQNPLLSQAALQHALKTAGFIPILEKNLELSESFHQPIDALNSLKKTGSIQTIIHHHDHFRGKIYFRNLLDHLEKQRDSKQKIYLTYHLLTGIYSAS